MIEPTFKNYQEYLEWCHQMVNKIYYANIVMNDESIRKAIKEIAWKMHVVEGQELWGNE